MSKGQSNEWTSDEVIGAGIHALRVEQGLTQDELARRLRDAGGDWDQAAIARLEAGRRGVSWEQQLLFAQVLGVPLHRLVAGDDDDWVTLAARARWRVSALRASYAGHAPSQMGADNFDDPMLQSLSRTLGGYHGKRALVIKAWPRATAAQVGQSVEAVGDAERKAGRRLGVDPVVISAVAHRRWGRSLADERDARAQRLHEEGVDRRSLQALRGHVTRQLLAELAPIVEEVEQ